MKRIIIAAIAVTATSVTFAQSTAAATQGTSVTIVNEEREKTPVKLEDLPDAVKKALKGPEFDGWKPVTAYWVKSDKASYYEIEVAKGEDKKTVNLAADGTRAI